MTDDDQATAARLADLDGVDAGDDVVLMYYTTRRAVRAARCTVVSVSSQGSVWSLVAHDHDSTRKTDLIAARSGFGPALTNRPVVHAARPGRGDDDANRTRRIGTMFAMVTVPDGFVRGT